ncbi:MAG: pyrophosphate--fructose-6-phosphate 1-phosphotransferase [Candidatus Marinimicrobia bacterium]|jgi:pyrophosphate--fructose-6-phosphate 1-phosphotransferase|nr:pyrophosphate--fructose-6-phosphate 1-phosphotransferase [Candidatus Neomarinimicrobiota bacterium]MBT3762698.1 pyrophosphate--fructose-6-phosphate 1-phosphotransferase [Candidatus Neomarinimicrobiota bacterium]MBT4068338.1 pyrophosphate--fructose-6-phosphate 1-phosphotransferase [Candidatus Neomarinimicrobiota bacterium]MBT4271105.1 pyrophosphate--fructose-6-phosphate 1-phosphotransferase [Candidatus Neomarinimicrobiota bacterium]MBT4372276.1 pyrophosphate--fructose-6-phosphate 1-phosphotra
MKIAFLTAGGIAPCLSASIGALIEAYNELAPEAQLIGYLNGYRGLLLGKSIPIPPSVRKKTDVLYEYGGSPIGNSRVKLTNVADCVKRGYVKDGEDPLEVAANQLVKDGIDILHTIGGDDTNTMAAQLSFYLKENNYNLTVVGLPKTVDNDVFPITQTLGAWTAAEQGAIFFENIANENTTSFRQLIIHEVMGRSCGWLTAYTAKQYHDRLKQRNFLPEILIDQERWDVDAIYIPEMEIDFDAECSRLKGVMDEKDSVNIFLSEGAGTDIIIEEMEAAGETVERDAFGHVALNTLNPGQWFAKQFTDRLEAEKTLVQKSGYFGRSAAPNKQDLDLIKLSGALGAKLALDGQSGVIGLDDDQNSELGLIDFDRIKGGKPFDSQVNWFNELLAEIGQK